MAPEGATSTRGRADAAADQQPHDDSAAGARGRGSPELVAAIESAIAGRNPRREGAEVRFRCPRPERHKNADVHQSCRWNRDKQAVYCDVCQLKGGATDLAKALGIDTRPPRQHAVKRQVVARYDYRDESGKLLYQIERVEPGNDRRKKDFRARRPDGNGGWTYDLHGVRRILCRLPELLAADTTEIVYIPEGEGKVDRLAALGLVATCSPHGAGKWRDEYAEHLRGRRVVVLCDADDPGRKHAEQIGRSVVGVAASVKVIELPGLGSAEDVVNWLNAGHTVEELAALVEAAPSWTSKDKDTPPSSRDEGDDWVLPIPLDAPCARTAFPAASLPNWVRDYVQALAVAYQVPVDLPAMIALAALAAGVARKYTLRVLPDWAESLALWCVVALPPSERKTPPVERIRAPIVAHEAAANEKLAPTIREAVERRALLEERVKQWRTKAAKTEGDARTKAEAELREAQDALAALVVPTPVTELTDDVTVERLGPLMVENGERIAIISDEGGIFDAIAGRYTGEGARANLDLWLRGYSGSEHRVARVGRPPDYLRRPSITMGVTVQPVVLEGLAAHPGLRRGLLARPLYAVPAPMAGHCETAPDPVSPSTENTWAGRLRLLYEIPTPKEPTELRLAPAARQVMLDWCEAIEPRRGPEGNLASLGEWAGKLRGQVARIAAVRHCASHAGRTIPTEIGVEHVDAAISLAEYLIDHARVALAMMGADPAVADARRTLRAAAPHAGKTVRRGELHRATRYDRRRLDEALRVLLDYGWLLPADGKPTGGRTASIYEVHQLAGGHEFSDASTPGFNGFKGVRSPGEASAAPLKPQKPGVAPPVDLEAATWGDL